MSLAPNSAYMWSYTGSVFTFLADYQIAHGLDAVKSVDQAIDNYRKSLAIDPIDTETLGILCITYSQRAQLEEERGKDPRPFFELGFQSARKALQINPNVNDIHTYLGAGLYWKAKYEMNHGLDPLPSINEAIPSYQWILKTKEDSDAYANTCEALNLKVQYLLLTGNSAHEPVKQAIGNCQKAVALAPDLDFSQVNLGIAYANLAEVEKANVSEFKQAVQKSRNELNRGLQINPKYPEAHFNLGRLEFLSAEVFHDERAFDRSRKNLARALEMNPKYDDARWLTAESYRFEGEAKYARRLDPSKEIEEGLKICDESGPNDSYLMAVKSALLSLRARSSSHPQTREQALAESKQNLNEALRLNANLRSRYSH